MAKKKRLYVVLPAVESIHTPTHIATGKRRRAHWLAQRSMGVVLIVEKKRKPRIDNKRYHFDFVG